MVVRGEHLLMYLRRYHLLPLLFRLSVSLPATEVVTLKVRSQHMNETESTCTKSTQLHDAFIGHARRRHQLIGCGETIGRLVLGQFSTRALQCCCSYWSSRTGVELSTVFSSSAVNKPLGLPPSK